MQYQARCNRATKPTPTLKKNLKLTVQKKKEKTPFNKSVQPKYIWDLHLVTLLRLYTWPLPSIYYLYEQTSFKPKQQHKTELEKERSHHTTH